MPVTIFPESEGADTGGEILSGIGNPNGVVTATGPAIYLDNTDPTAPVIYVKSTSGTSNNEWV